MAHERQKGPAGAISQECQADHHIGEMVPLNDGEEPHQQDFVAECGGRDEEN